MLSRTTSQALRTYKPLATHVRCTSPSHLAQAPAHLSPTPGSQPLLARTYASNGSSSSSMGTSRSGWFRTEAEKTRAIWAGALLAVIGGYWYMTREPVSAMLLFMSVTEHA